MVRRTGVLVINPAANETYPGFGIKHSLRGLRIECNDCIDASLANHALRNGLLHFSPENTLGCVQIPPMPLPSHPPQPDENIEETGDNTGDGTGDSTEGAEPASDEPACVMVFNAGDPTGAGGLSADITAVASVGGHALPVMTGAYARDTAEIVDHFPLDDEAVSAQARTVLEDVSVQVFKVGFAGTPENLSAIAEIASDYADVPLILYMPDLSWWTEPQIDAYLDACKELLLPQTTVLAGNHSTLWRWLLPDWSGDKNPSARDIARAAHAFGTPYTLVTGIPLPDQFIDNVLASPKTVLASQKFERFEATFCGAGDTLSAALAALLATGTPLPEAFNEAMGYLDRSLDNGFRPGMGHVIPDRMFWAKPDDSPDDDLDEATDKAGDEGSDEQINQPSNDRSNKPSDEKSGGRSGKAGNTPSDTAYGTRPTEPGISSDLIFKRPAHDTKH